MNRFGKLFFKALPHASIVMAGMLIVFFCIDRVNTPMGFMTNEFHKWLTFFLALISIGYSVFVIMYQRHQERLAEKRRRQAQAQARKQAAARKQTRPAPASRQTQAR